MSPRLKVSLMTSSRDSDITLLDIAAIRAAAARIAGEAVLTPLLESPAVNARLGGPPLIKAEPPHRTGSFHVRGPPQNPAHLPADPPRRGGAAPAPGQSPPRPGPAAPAA